jgi:hypothetical protein
MPTYTDWWLLEELAEEVRSGGVWLLADRTDLADKSL